VVLGLAEIIDVAIESTGSAVKIRIKKSIAKRCIRVFTIKFID
jgi:hypothetical protein